MIYEYKCSDCTELFEVWAKMSDAPPAACPKCESPKIERVISVTSFALKGSGWYTTDYKRKAAAPATPANSTEVSSAPKAEAPTPGGTCGTGGCGHKH